VKIGPAQWRRSATLRQGARNILAPTPTKTTEFEVKNRCKSAEEAKTKQLLQMFGSLKRI